MSLKVFVVDDYHVARAGFARFLAAETDLELAGEAATADEALEKLSQVPADVIILDYHIPGMGSIDLCRELAERRSPAAIVVLSYDLDDDAAWSCLAAGARGYVLKEAASAELMVAIRAAARGELYLDPKIAARILGSAARAAQENGRDLLTPAVRRVLRLAVDGHSNGEIARTMGLSAHTVKSHLASAYRKLGVRDRAEAAAMVTRRGLI